jgi:aminotransferase EvaB
MRIQPLQAIVALHGMKELDNIIAKRNKNATYLDKLLNNDRLKEFVKIPVRNKKNYETQSLYMGLFEDRDDLIKYLIKNGIEAKIHYPIPLHLQEAAKQYGYKKSDFPISENQAHKLVTLPIHQYINNEQIEYMYETINNYYFKN